MFDNFPPGVANDPNAPWNEKDEIFTEWESSGTTDQCHYCGETAVVDFEGSCEDCFTPEVIEDESDDDDWRFE